MVKTKFKIGGINIEIDNEILKEFPNAQSEITKAVFEGILSENKGVVIKTKYGSAIVNSNGAVEVLKNGGLRNEDHSEKTKDCRGRG